jgi:hypothetical protein
VDERPASLVAIPFPSDSGRWDSGVTLHRESVAIPQDGIRSETPSAPAYGKEMVFLGSRFRKSASLSAASRLNAARS